VQQNHIYPSANVLYTSAVLSPDLPLHANISKENPLLSRLVIEYISANQLDKQIRYISICTGPGHKLQKKIPLHKIFCDKL